MRKLLWLPALIGLAAASVNAAMIQYQTTDLADVTPGQDLRRYTYFVSGFTLSAYEEVDIRFDPALFGSVSNASASSDFDLMIMPPNSPPGAFGDVSMFALVDNPSLAQPLMVDVVFLGQGEPGVQPFVINKYNQAGEFVSEIARGSTEPWSSPSDGVPEPATVLLCCGGLLAGAIRYAVRGRSRRAA